MLLAKNNCFRGDLIYPQNQHRKITGSLMVLRRPGDVLHRDTYAAFLVPEGTVYRDLRTNLSAYLVNPGTLAACTGVPSAKKTDLYEYDVVRFGNQYDPYLIVYDREHLCFAIKNARQCLPLYACMGPELTILGNLFQDGDYLYESPLLDPWLYLRDAEQERLERAMFGSRYETDRQTIRDADESILQRALTAGEGRRGWLQGSLITLKGKTGSGKFTQRCFLVPEDTTEEDFVSGRVLPEEIYPDSLSRATGLVDAAGDLIFEGDSLVHAAGNIPFTLDYVLSPAGYSLRGPEGDIPATPSLLRQMFIANDELEEQESQKIPHEAPKASIGSTEDPAPGTAEAKMPAPKATAPKAAPKATAPKMQQQEPEAQQDSDCSGITVQCRKCGKITKYGYGKCPACREPLDPNATDLRDPVEWTPAYQKGMKRARKNIEAVFRQRYPQGDPKDHARQYDRIVQQELLKVGVYWKTPEEIRKLHG